jgi:hypothetical protein
MTDQSKAKAHYAHEIVGMCYYLDNGQPDFYTIECLDCDLILMSDPTEQRGN